MKILKRSLIVLSGIGLVLIIKYVIQTLPIVTGYAAKVGCSCVFVGERSREDVLANELAHFPQSLGDIQISWNDSIVTGSVGGFFERQALFRKGLGCTLVAGMTEDEIKKQQVPAPPPLPYDPDTLPWPAGNRIDLEKLQASEYNEVRRAVDLAFEEKDPSKPVNTRAVLVVHKGHIVAEKYAEGFSAVKPQLGWSMTKSITNALIGILVKEGQLTTSDTELFPEWSNEEDPRARITLDDLLKMSSGLKWLESYYTLSPVTEMIYTQADMGTFASSFFMEYTPGEHWEYSSGTTNILSRKMRDLLGDAYHTFPYEALFHKIGMTNTLIEVDASGGFVASSYGWGTPRDWARFGLLYLNDGVWEGERILPEGWVSYSSAPIPQAPKGNYAVQFWHIPTEKPQIIPPDTYFAQGFEGQRVIIIPSKSLVIVRLGQTHFGNFDWESFISQVLRGLN